MNLAVYLTALEQEIRTVLQSEAERCDRLLGRTFARSRGEGSRLCTGEEAAIVQAVEALVQLPKLR